MKNKSLLKWTIVFFIIVSTTYFWEVKLGALGIIISIVLFGYYLVLVIGFLFQIIRFIQEKFINKERFILISIMTFVLVSAYFKPKGLIDFDALEGNDILIAQREGVANCFIRLKLKENNLFIKKTYCFGVTEIRGKYNLKGDTIFFTDTKGDQIENFYQFGVIKSNSNSSIILYFNSEGERMSDLMLLKKNELIKPLY